MHFACCLNKKLINGEGNRLFVGPRVFSEGMKILFSDTSEALMSSATPTIIILGLYKEDQG